MDRIRQLQAARDESRKQIRELLDAATRDKRALTDEEREKATALQREAEQIEATLRLEEARLQWDRDAAPAIQRPDADPMPAAQAAAAAAQASPASTRATAMANFGRFLQSVANVAIRGEVDPTLLRAAPSGMNTGVPSEGGFLVRQEFSTALLNRAMEEAVIAPRCWSVPIGEGFDGIELPMVEETSRANGSRWGGVQVYRRGEADTVTATKPKIGRLDLRLEDLMGICYATERGLQDAVSLGEVISKAFASEFAFKLDDEIIRGTGVGQCTGILNAPAKIAQAKEGGQTAATVVADNVLKMRSRLRAKSRLNSVWLINQELEPQLYKMYVAAGVAGVPIWMPANGLSGEPYDTLFARPVLPIEQCEAAGTEGDIIAANFDEYMLISKGGIVTAESIHVRFLYGENTFRFTWRVNGAPTWKSALTPYKGTATVSPFVTLATRA